MTVLFWFLIVILAVPLLFTMGVFKGDERGLMVTWVAGAAALVAVASVGFYNHVTPHYYEGEVKITVKEYKESYRERGVKGGYRIIPECYRIIYLPTIEPKLEPEHHIGGACLSEDQWDQVEVSDIITVARDKNIKPWGWKTL